MYGNFYNISENIVLHQTTTLEKAVRINIICKECLLQKFEIIFSFEDICMIALWNFKMERGIITSINVLLTLNNVVLEDTFMQGVPNFLEIFRDALIQGVPKLNENNYFEIVRHAIIQAVPNHNENLIKMLEERLFHVFPDASHLEGHLEILVETFAETIRQKMPNFNEPNYVEIHFENSILSCHENTKSVMERSIYV